MSSPPPPASSTVPCVPIAEIYGLSDYKALAFAVDQTLPDTSPGADSNATMRVTDKWVKLQDDVLLREKTDSGTYVQPTQVQREFVWGNYYVVHTNLPFQKWCKAGRDCGCVQAGFFGVTEPQGVSSSSSPFLRGGGLIVIIVLAPLLCMLACLCVLRRHRLQRATVHFEDTGSSPRSLATTTTKQPKAAAAYAATGSAYSSAESASGGRAPGEGAHKHRPPPMPPGYPPAAAMAGPGGMQPSVGGHRPPPIPPREANTPDQQGDGRQYRRPPQPPGPLAPGS